MHLDLNMLCILEGSWIKVLLEVSTDYVSILCFIDTLIFGSHCYCMLTSNKCLPASNNI